MFSSTRHTQFITTWWNCPSAFFTFLRYGKRAKVIIVPEIYTRYNRQNKIIAVASSSKAMAVTPHAVRAGTTAAALFTCHLYEPHTHTHVWYTFKIFYPTHGPCDTAAAAQCRSHFKIYWYKLRVWLCVLIRKNNNFASRVDWLRGKTYFAFQKLLALQNRKL